MQHQIPLADLGPDGPALARAVSTCVHCGFCLAACPTYKVLGEEMDSPRGRIVLMKEALEGTLTLEDARPYVDRCLGCLGCETACPSGVRYRDLLAPFRARLEERARPVHARLARQALLAILESPVRFRAAWAAARAMRVVAPALPTRLRSMLALLPDAVPPRAAALPSTVPAAGPRRARVALHTGCVQRVLRPSINDAAIRVLSAEGVEVIVPPDQGCCGALALHSGHVERGRRLAAQHARQIPIDVDAVLTTAAGCGSAMKDHRGETPVQDITEFLDALGPRTPRVLDRPMVAAYHDACHLSHAQGIRLAPRRLLRQVTNLTLVEIGDGETCCGSAGLYNLEHPAPAAALGRRKAAAIAATGAELAVSANLGCLRQIEASGRVRAAHVVELLDWAQGNPPRRGG